MEGVKYNVQIDIPGYSVVSTLSQGVAATVYLALDQHRRGELALKVMPLEGHQADLPAQFLARERVRIQRLHHPNIVEMLDVGVHAGHYFLAMEYVPGSTLNHKRFELDLLARLRVIIDIAKALDFIAGQDFVHGGLSPENILIHTQDGRAVVLGFSLSSAAKFDNKSVAPCALSASGFESPEQMRGEILDSRSDLYSLGALLFLLLTDDLPFTAASLVANNDANPRQPFPHLPEHLQAFQPILDRLLNSQRAARYQRASECIADLGALPESAVRKAIEGFELSLVQERELPQQLVAHAAATIASEDLVAQDSLVSSTPISAGVTTQLEQETSEVFFIDDDVFPSQADLRVDNNRILENVRARPYEDFPLILIAVIGLAIPVAIYFAGQHYSAPTPDLNEIIASPENSARPAIAVATATEKYVLVAAPDLAAQAATLRAQLEQNFALATDLVVIYRAALRGDDPDEHAFARAGLAELQQLFGKRIHAHVAAQKLDAAVAERDLAKWLFEPEEQLPVLTDAFAAVE